MSFKANLEEPVLGVEEVEVLPRIARLQALQIPENQNLKQITQVDRDVSEVRVKKRCEPATGDPKK